MQIPARQDPHQDSLLATALVTQTDTVLVPAEFSAWPAPRRDNTFNNTQNNSPVSNAALPHAFPLPGEWRRCCSSSTRAHTLASALPSSILGKIQKELAVYCPGQFFGILLDLLWASAAASVVTYASSSHPCSLTHWNKEKPLYFYLYSKFCSGLFPLPFFTHFQRWKLFGVINYQLNPAFLMTCTQIYHKIRAALLIRDKPSVLKRVILLY